MARRSSSNSNQPGWLQQSLKQTRVRLKPWLLWGTGITMLVGVSAVGVAIAIAALAGDSPWIPWPQRGETPFKIYQSGTNMTQAQAREHYKQAYTLWVKKKDPSALALYQALEPAYPGLKGIIALRMGEIYAEQGQESQLQNVLKTVEHDPAARPFGPVIDYRLGQSYVRASQPQKAKKVFEALVQEFPKSSYAIGAQYYLGTLVLSEDPPQPEVVTTFWRNYLEKSPKGRFSLNITEAWKNNSFPIETADHCLMGRAYVESEQQWGTAADHLKRCIDPAFSFHKGTAQIQNGDRTEGIQSLINGMPYAPSDDEAEAAIDFMRKYTTRLETVNALKTISKLPDGTSGGDYSLWLLAQYEPENRTEYLTQLINRFGSGDYAPESSWSLLWPKLAEGNYTEFLTGAQAHFDRHPHSRSGPRALFWMAKVYEKQGHKEKAKALYERIQSEYTDSYYAFRSHGRLIHLMTGQTDPGWWAFHSPNSNFKALAERLQYPPHSAKTQVSVLPPKAVLGTKGFAQGKELEAIGAVDDLAVLVKSVTGKTPPAVVSLQAFEAGDRYKAIRTIREAVILNSREGQEPSIDELKLMYPVVFSDTITSHAKKNKIHPYIVQSLMREESFFNEMAVSTSNAMGLMQLLPSTAREVANWVHMDNFQPLDLFQPTTNITLGSKYLGYLHERFTPFPHTGMLAVGAYNGGPGAMGGWIDQRRDMLNSDPDLFVESIPYEQTRDYIKKVYSSFWNYSRLYGGQSIPGAEAAS